MSTDTPVFLPLHDDDDEGPATASAVMPADISQLMQRLTRRLNSTAQPSQLINQLHAAEQRCAEARTTLRDLVAKAPRIVQQLQLVLRDAFSVAPETLLFTEPLPPAEPTRIESLTERALASLSQRAYPADINSFTALSIKRVRHSPLTMTPADAMGKLQCLNLLERLDVAHEAYWQALAYGSWRSRKERWAEVYRQLFADKAFVAHQVQDLSDHGLAMVLGIVDAPTPEQRQQAGGFWSDLQVCELVWPGSGTSQVPVCGALHIFRDADQGLRRQVVFLPGLRREFLEFRSLADMQRDLPKVLNDEEHALVWQRLPLRRRDELLRFSDIVELIPFKVERGPIIAEDALRYSALSDLETQWDNELACALAINPALTFEQGFGDAPRLNAITRLQRLERSRYRAAQRRFLSSVWARDSRLMEVLPDLETFARQQLIEQLTRDGLYPDIDIDTPAFDVPDDVRTQWESHPVRPIGDSGSKVVVSQERRTYSLLQLALRNLDAQAPWTPLILRNTVYRVPKWKERLSADYLIRTLSSMDIGGRYEKRILEAFYPEQAGGVAQELMWRVHQEQARMVLFSACQQGLGKLARRMFTTALAVRSAEGLVCDDMHLRLCVVRLCGLTLEQPRHVSALLVIQDRITGTCVVYWPDAIGHRAITEYPNEEAALSELMATAASPIHLPELARKIAPGWEDQALKSYPGHLKRAFEDVIPREMSGGLTKVLERVVSKGPLGILASAVNWLMPKKAVAALTLTDIEDEIRQQISVNPQGWLEIVPTNGHDALSMLAHAQVLGIQRHARSLSNSTEALGEYRAQRLGEQSDIRMRSLLGLIPLVSILVNVYEVLLAARRLSLSGDSRDIVELVFAVHMTVLDIATTFVPQGKLAVGVASKGVRAGMARALFAYRGGIHSVLMRQAISIQRLAALGDTLLAKTFKGLEAYQLHGLSAGQGVALHGPLNQGSYVLNGKQFVPDGDRAYPVYRRKQENALRVKSPKEDGQNEFFLHIQESGEVLLKADAPEPPAGAQRPLWQPWRGEAPSGPQPGSSRPTTSSTISPDVTPSPPLERLARVLEQPEMPLTDIPSAWRVGPELQPTQITPLSKRLFTIRGGARHYRAIKLREAFFEVLPDGSQPNEQIAFVHDRTPLATDARFDIARWLGNDISRQPIPVSFDKMGRATLRQVLFTEPLDDSIAKAFPGMTASSRRGVASRLAELADPERSVTASHLLNIRATLDRWLSVSGLPAQTDELFQLLRPTSLPGTRRSIYIGYEALAAGLERLDFTYDASAASLLRTQSFHARTHAVHQAMRNVLEAHGFVIQRIRHRESRIFGNMICTHPSSNKVYFIVERWLDRASVATKNQAKPLLSDAWLNSYWYRSYEKRQFFTVVQQAREQGRLVRLVGGIQHVAKKNPGTVFFIKVVEP
ncbi:hypothetical protein HZF02_09330 [Pseudomonas yamanorum]|nr:hypothetical protein HZF02_09330 [Pseudomonas yamanorum]